MPKQTVKKTTSTTKNTITIRPKTSSNTSKKPGDQPRAANGQFAPRVK